MRSKLVPIARKLGEHACAAFHGVCHVDRVQAHLVDQQADQFGLKTGVAIFYAQRNDITGAVVLELAQGQLVCALHADDEICFAQQVVRNGHECVLGSSASAGVQSAEEAEEFRCPATKFSQAANEKNHDANPMRPRAGGRWLDLNSIFPCRKALWVHRR